MNTTKPRMLHLSVIHLAHHPRIVYRTAVATAQCYDTWLVMPAKATPNLPANIQFIPLVFYPKIWQRLLFVQPRVLLYCLKIRPNILQIHNPELIPLGLIMSLLGTKTVLDVLENSYLQTSAKAFNNGWVYRQLFRFFDSLAQRYFYIILAEKAYLKNYQNIRKPYAIIQNFTEIEAPPPALTHRQAVFYLGQISKARGIDVLFEAIALLKTRFPAMRVNMVGDVGFDIRKEDIPNLPHYETVKENFVFHGSLPHTEALPLASNAFVGLALLKPVGDFPDSYPSKLFEYMALGLPVVTSNFALYKPVIEKHACGFCIDPTDANALAQTLVYLLENPTEAHKMGLRGQEAVKQDYSWPIEKEKLMRFYENIIHLPVF